MKKTVDAREKFVTKGLNLCLRSGLTGVQTNDEHTLETYQDLLKSSNGLPIRVFLTPLHQEITEQGQFFLLIFLLILLLFLFWF